MINRIVTRGMGTNSKLVSRGYAGVFHEVVETIRRIRGVGPSPARRKDYDEIIIRAELIEINNEIPQVKVFGHIRVVLNRTTSRIKALSEHVTTNIRRTMSDIVIYVKQIKRKKHD